MKEIIITSCLACCAGGGKRRTGALGDKRVGPRNSKCRSCRWRRQKSVKVAN